MLQYYRNTIIVPSPSRAVKHEQTLFQIKCSNKSLCQQLLSPPAVLYAALHLELIASCMLSCVVMVKLFHGHKSNICQERAFLVFLLWQCFCLKFGAPQEWITGVARGDHKLAQRRPTRSGAGPVRKQSLTLPVSHASSNKWQPIIVRVLFLNETKGH